MSRRLYVGNLSHRMDEEVLNNILTVYGTVMTSTIVFNKNFRSRRCFAIVEMSSPEEAASAVLNLNGCAFYGRSIYVKSLNSDSKSMALITNFHFKCEALK